MNNNTHLPCLYIYAFPHSSAWLIWVISHLKLRFSIKFWKCLRDLQYLTAITCFCLYIGENTWKGKICCLEHLSSWLRSAEPKWQSRNCCASSPFWQSRTHFALSWFKAFCSCAPHPHVHLHESMMIPLTKSNFCQIFCNKCSHWQSLLLNLEEFGIFCTKRGSLAKTVWECSQTTRTLWITNVEAQNLLSVPDSSQSVHRTMTCCCVSWLLLWCAGDGIQVSPETPLAFQH